MCRLPSKRASSTTNTESLRPGSAALGEGSIWTCKPRGRRLPRQRDPMTPARTPNPGRPPGVVGRSAHPRGPARPLPGPPRPLPGPDPYLALRLPAPLRRAPAGTLRPAAWVRRGHLTVRIPPAALRGLRGRSGCRAGRGGGGGGAGEGEAEAGAAAEAEAGAGNERADAPAAAPSATSREIARLQADSQSRALARVRVAAAARKRGTPASVLAQNSPHGALALRIGARVKRRRPPLVKMAAVEASWGNFEPGRRHLD